MSSRKYRERIFRVGRKELSVFKSTARLEHALISTEQGKRISTQVMARMKEILRERAVTTLREIDDGWNRVEFRFALRNNKRKYDLEHPLRRDEWDQLRNIYEYALFTEASAIPVVRGVPRSLHAAEDPFWDAHGDDEGAVELPIAHVGGGEMVQEVEVGTLEGHGLKWDEPFMMFCGDWPSDQTDGAWQNEASAA